MDGKNKNIEKETPFESSVWPKYPISATAGSANHFNYLSPSNLPISPTSFNYVGLKPYFMNQGVAAGTSVGGSSSGTKSSFFSGLECFAMRGENNKADQNSFHPPTEKLILGAPSNTVVANAVRGRGDVINEQNMDPKKLRRVISNRLSAQRSRVRRLQHVSDMEKKVESLQVNFISLLISLCYLYI
ncbi:basic leucine zipper 34-like [Hibiscus syriacus]|uniref:basic leucine zipper 34-like n=1 Tax=Hibiscus syriacus TaxID=106335 RepID=UPI0019224612|nr:basic leucine zipper 34-like [Hibiscus syriacus]